MSEHVRTLSAIFPLILKGNGENTKSAVIRECKEELGIDVKIEDLTFVQSVALAA